MMGLCKTTIIFEEDRFTLETRKKDSQIEMKHACHHRMRNLLPLAVSKVFVYPNEAQACWRCEVIIPVGIIALYKLYKWGKE